MPETIKERLASIQSRCIRPHGDTSNRLQLASEMMSLLASIQDEKNPATISGGDFEELGEDGKRVALGAYLILMLQTLQSK